MFRSKLIQILSSFDEEEWRACHKYLKYASKKEAVTLQLFEFLFKSRHSLTDEGVRKELILNKVFPGRSIKFLLNAASALSTDIESYLLEQYLHQKNQKLERKLHVAQIYKSKGLYSCFERTINELKKEAEKRPALDLFYHLKKLQIHHLHYFSESYSRSIRPYSSLQQAEYELNQFSRYLQEFYKIEKEYTQAMTEVNPYQVAGEEDNGLKELLNHITRINTFHDATSEAYVTDILKNNSENISEELSAVLLITLLNECIYQTKRNSVIHKERMAALYLYGLNSGILLHNGRLSEKRFLNIIDVLSKSPLSLTAEGFINEWIEKVETPHRVSLENLAYALWLFALGDYIRALQKVEISETKLIDINLSIRARWIKVCALCSLYPEYEEKPEVLDAARLFFIRHKKEMTKQTYQASQNLLKIVRMFWESRSHREIHQFLVDNPVIVQRHWIEQQLEKWPDHS